MARFARLTGSDGRVQNADAPVEGLLPGGGEAHGSHRAHHRWVPSDLSHRGTEGMTMRLHLDTGLWAVALLATLGFAGTAVATPVDCDTTLNFSDSQYTACFTDVRRGLDINDDNAPDLGGTGHTALNFTGGAGPAGDTWVTKFTPNGGTRICALGGLNTVLLADVLIHTFNNTKGAGLMALLDPVPGGKALALILYDQGNSDALQLATIDPATGQLTKVKSVSLGAGIAENAWYRLRMVVNVNGD